jgi:fatty acid desaturase
VWDLSGDVFCHASHVADTDPAGSGFWNEPSMADGSGSINPGDAALQQAIRALRKTDNWRNFGYLAREWACLIGVIGGAVVFAEQRAGWGLPWAADVPVFLIAIVLIGGLQHRLAGLGHEAAHHTFLKNRLANDLVADVCCMIPILTCVHLYRLFHLAHHQYTNDPHLDPDLVNLGQGKRVDDYPMPRWRCILLTHFRWLVSPRSFLEFQGAYLYVNTLGKGGNVYMRRVAGGDADHPWPRRGTWLGIVGLVGFAVLVVVLARGGLGAWLGQALLAAVLGGVLGVALVPERWIFRAPFRQAYGTRVIAALRLTIYLAAIAGLGGLFLLAGPRGPLYVLLLWFVPLGTSFMHLMLLRDIYQHTNADDGRLTNTRVFVTDPFTRWAVFVYGQDIHLAHHLFPAIPHYNLGRLHALLKARDRAYAEQVVECHGTFVGSGGHPSILETLTREAPMAEPATGVAPAPL